MALRDNRYNSGIYRIVIKRNGKEDAYYIGQSSDLTERWKCHVRAMRAGRHDNVRMQRAFKKYGDGALTFEVLLICEPTKDALTMYEQAILDFYLATYGDRQVFNVMKKCVNTHLGVKRRPETCERLSRALKGKKFSHERIEKMRIISTGHHHTEETKRKLSETNKGMIPHPNSIAALNASRNSEKRIQRISEAKRASGYTHSQATRDKISQSLTGKKQSSETIEKRFANIRGRKQTPEEIAKRVASRLANKMLKQAENSNV